MADAAATRTLDVDQHTVAVTGGASPVPMSTGVIADVDASDRTTTARDHLGPMPRRRLAPR